MTFRTFEERKPWNALVDTPKPLTNRSAYNRFHWYLISQGLTPVFIAWANLLPKLTPILQENRERQIANGIKERRIERRACVHEFLVQIKQAEHPYEPIIIALMSELPDTLASDALSTSSVSRIPTSGGGIENPFPKTHTALQWDCLNDLGEREISVEEVKAELIERRNVIEQRISEWRVCVERRLVERFESVTEEVKDDIRVTVGLFHNPVNPDLIGRVLGQGQHRSDFSSFSGCSFTASCRHCVQTTWRGSHSSNLCWAASVAGK
jgi:hypothetical protein